jgi:hypothetical protein
MKFVLLVYQGSTPLPGSDPWQALSEAEQKAIYADYAELNKTEGVAPGLPLGLPDAARTVQVRHGKTHVKNGTYLAEGAAGYAVYPLNWNTWIRQTHRWVSLAFTVAVIVNIVALGTQEEPAVWVGFVALLPLALLLFTGLYLFVLPYAIKWRSGRRTDVRGTVLGEHNGRQDVREVGEGRKEGRRQAGRCEGGQTAQDGTEVAVPQGRKAGSPRFSDTQVTGERQRP